MSFFPGKDPQAGDVYACDAIAHVVVPRTVDLGDGFSVRRALPSEARTLWPEPLSDRSRNGGEPRSRKRDRSEASGQR